MKYMDQYVHSTFLKNIYTVYVKVKRHYENGEVEDLLIKKENLSRDFYVTKPSLMNKNDTDHLQWEDLENLNKFTCLESEKELAMFKALYGFYPKKIPNIRELYKNKYLFGANIEIETLVKEKISSQFNKDPAPSTTGFFDTETDLKTQHLTIASITHEGQVYTGIVKDFFKIYDEKTDSYRQGSLDELRSLINVYINQDLFTSDLAKSVFNDYNFKYNIYIAEDELDLVKYIFHHLHKNKTDIVGIWNLPFDIELILDVCKRYNYDPKYLFSDPNIEDKYFHYKKDEGRKDKHTSHHRRWHWVTSPSHHKFIDSMCLYSILRLVKGQESSYALDYILEKNKISDGKLSFKNIPQVSELSSVQWHRVMQKKFRYEYIVYNIFDVVSLQVMEKINNDILGMNILSGNTPLQNFNYQTKRTADVFHFRALEKDKVIASSGQSVETFEGIIKVGGAVADSNLVYNIGRKNFITEIPYNHETYAVPHVSDIDLSAMYPYSILSLNMSGETKVSTIKHIEGFAEEDIAHLSSLLSHLEENSVLICNKFLGLPDYEDLITGFDQYLRNI